VKKKRESLGVSDFFGGMTLKFMEELAVMVKLRFA
jgi:hypothetical protein